MNWLFDYAHFFFKYGLFPFCFLQRIHRHELFTPAAVVVHPDDSRSKFQVKNLFSFLAKGAALGVTL